ncbi:hypothetical protein MC378_06705 [Polaribacter sp. MSW13]|uniref:Uncharacterized protein n=1 Tax=Polaribacter marinus TaxID=2916838 RepID=A0A9X2AJX8_9FLAO|nr:hypothetical protein [Polaribacter marinus]MCI2228853.1 hypothetical protein [Polaribacter marinus]
MKKLTNYLLHSLILLIIICFSFCTNRKSGKLSINNDNDIQNKQISCIKKVNFGKNILCLPKIDGMTESYDNILIKNLADKFESKDNKTLAFYLNNDTFSRIENIKDEKLEDYYKIFVSKGLINEKVDINLINNFAKRIEEGFIEMKWEKLENNIRNQLPNLSFDKPILIDSYSPHKNVRTQVTLSKIIINEREHFMICASNLMLINERLIFSAYYLKYKEKKSFQKTKEKNDYLVLKILEENKVKYNR